MKPFAITLAVALFGAAYAENISFSENGKRLLYCSSDKNKAWVYSLGAKKPLCTVPSSFARLSPDGNRVVAVGTDQKLHCFDCKSSKQLWTGGAAVRFEQSGNGQLVLVEDRVYNGLSGKLLGSWKPPNALAPDSKSLVHGEYDSVQVLSLPSGKVEKDVKVAGLVANLSCSPGEVACAYSPDGKRTTMVLLEYPGLRSKRNFDNPESNVSPDGTMEWKGELTVTRKGKVVYRGKSGERVSVWGKGGGFLLGQGRTPIAFLASNGQPIPGAERNWRAVPGTKLGYTFLDRRLTCFNVDTGAKLGEISGVSAVGDSLSGGRLGYNGKSGVVVIEAAPSVKAGKLVTKPVS